MFKKTFTLFLAGLLVCLLLGGCAAKMASAAESQQYVQQLQDAGYTELQSAESSVSAGTILARDDAYLSVSYADGVLGIVITLRKNAK